MPQLSQRAKVILAMGVLYVVWGTTYLAIKVGLDANLPPALFAGVRQIPAAAIMFALAFWRGSPLRVSSRDLRIACIAGILLIVGGQYFTFLAEQHVPSGISALVVALIPLWIALAESAFPDMQRPGRLGLAGTRGGLLRARDSAVAAPRRCHSRPARAHRHRDTDHRHVAVDRRHDLLQAPPDERRQHGHHRVGDARGRRDPAGHRHGARASGRSFQLDAKGLGALLYLIVFGSAIAFTAFTYALTHLPASKVMTYAYVNPVIAVFAGALAGRIGLVPPEPVTLSTLLGMVVIVGGVALTTAAPTLPAATPSDNAASCGAGRRAARRAGPSEVYEALDWSALISVSQLLHSPFIAAPSPNAASCG